MAMLMRSIDDMSTARSVSLGFRMIAVAAVLCWGAASTGAQQAPSAPAQSGAAPAKPIVTVARVVSQKLDRPVSFPGDLVAFQDVDLRAKVQHFVKSTCCRRGPVRSKGP